MLNLHPLPDFLLKYNFKILLFLFVDLEVIATKQRLSMKL